MLCLAVATTLAVFFFIFYPERIEMKLPLMIGTTLRLAGPVALWIGVFLFLWQLDCISLIPTLPIIKSYLDYMIFSLD